MAAVRPHLPRLLSIEKEADPKIYSCYDSGRGLREITSIEKDNQNTHTPAFSSARPHMSEPLQITRQSTSHEEGNGNEHRDRAQIVDSRNVPSDILEDTGTPREIGDGPGLSNRLEKVVMGSKERRNNTVRSLVDASSEKYAGELKEKEKVLKLSAAKIPTLKGTMKNRGRWNISEGAGGTKGKKNRRRDRSQSNNDVGTPSATAEESPEISAFLSERDSQNPSRPSQTVRTVSSPLLKRRSFSSQFNGSAKIPLRSSTKLPKAIVTPLRFGSIKSDGRMSAVEDPQPSPMPQSIPVPPLSLATYLQLELSSQRPSPLYIHRSVTSDFPYESSQVKIERLQNFLLLPPQLEQVLWFGALACLDAWLFSFTILPLRFLKALSILGGSWVRNLAIEIRFVGAFVYAGTGRMWRRRQQRPRESFDGSAAPEAMSAAKRSAGPALTSTATAEGASNATSSTPELKYKPRGAFGRRHRRTKSVPSPLRPDQKADILKGLLIVISCVILMYFDASRMYHGIRGQAAIKLYVIYNVLEVCDRLFSALGQDILECLFSKESLERKPDGRSKVLRPFWLFLLALCYNLVHATALFYQVITLNVAVNSYSNALLTLLMSNQFVEIKSTVFKKFEKENLFQLTCADVVERFQLWLMLMIIASRNIIETGGLSIGNGEPITSSSSAFRGSSVLPKSFTMLPKWTGQVMGPFFLVLGSEMLVDWVKHAYITKFNNTKPAIYGRFLDVLAKDYYSNAFADQNLTRRLGLPVIPLACLFIRASVQTYHMFLATHMPFPLPSTATSLSVDSAVASPATTAALQHMDQIFRRALGRSAFGAGDPTLAPELSKIWSTDDIIAFVTMLVFFLILFLALLAFKLVLGMCLLSFARGRYKGMKEREKTSTHADGRRVGGWGVVEVDEDKRRWIYMDDPDAARKLREREREARERKGEEENFGSVSRYSMAAKRIW
ncbi:eukaryotic membrane protein family-domain-containing protein [Usnea florida]